MKNKDLEIVFVLELIKLGNENLLEMYKELLNERLDEAEGRNKVVDELHEEIKRFKRNATGGND
jgi:hypothetical protein